MTRRGEVGADAQPDGSLEEHEVPRELDGRAVDGDHADATSLLPAQMLAQERMLVHRHRMGFTSALMAIVTLGGGALIVGAFTTTAERWAQVERAGVLVVVPLLTLLGSALGWYYGGQKNGGA